jgi:uridine kinase
MTGADDMSKNGHDKEYAPVVDALAPVLHNLPARIIAIDGRPGCGKTTLGRFLAWWFNVSLIETDLFLFEREGLYRYRTEEAARIIDFRIRADRPVIIEGVTVLRQLAAMNRSADFLIYVANASAPTLRSEYEVQFKDYEAEFKPHQRANFTLALDH